MTTMVPVPICGREDWTILMPEERAQRVQWPWHEWNRFHSMFHNLRPGDVLFDIGAEQGDQSALYQRWIQRAEWDDEFGREHIREGGIVLVEPNLKAWPCIKAVWDANGLRKPLGFSTNATTDQSWLNLRPESDWPDAARYPIEYPIGTADEEDLLFPLSVDHVVEMLDLYPDAISMDIEGGEFDALHGAVSVLEQHKPLVWVSIHWQMLRDRGQSREELIDYMADLGYRFEHLGADHEEHALFHHPEGRRPVLPYDGVMGS